MNRDYAAAGMRRASFAYWFAVLIAIAAVLSFATCIYGCFHIVDTASAVFAVFGLIASAAFSAVWIRIALDERRDPRTKPGAEPPAVRPRPMTVSILDAWGTAAMIAAFAFLLYRYLFPPP